MRPKPSTAASTSACPPSTVATSLRVGDRGAAGVDDLGGDGGRRPGVGALAPHRAAEVVDDDARAPRREQPRVGAPDAPPRAGDDRDAPVEAVLAQPGLTQAGTGA